MIIRIDTNKWTTPMQYARMQGVSKQVVNNWIKRGKVETKYIAELDLRLIRLPRCAGRQKQISSNAE